MPAPIAARYSISTIERPSWVLPRNGPHTSTSRSLRRSSIRHLSIPPSGEAAKSSYRTSLMPVIRRKIDAIFSREVERPFSVLLRNTRYSWSGIRLSFYGVWSRSSLRRIQWYIKPSFGRWRQGWRRMNA